MNSIIISEYFIIQDSINQLLYNNFNMEEITNLRSLNDLRTINIDDYDLLIINIDTNDNTILSTIRSLKATYNNLKIVILNLEDNISLGLEYIQANADAYILDFKEKSEFVYALSKVINGKKYFDSSLLQSLLNTAYSNESALLTNREMNILEEVAKGLTNKEIANNTFVSEYTVKKHISNILKKLNLKSRRDIMIYARKTHTS